MQPALSYIHALLGCCHAENSLGRPALTWLQGTRFLPIKSTGAACRVRTCKSKKRNIRRQHELRVASRNNQVFAFIVEGEKGSNGSEYTRKRKREHSITQRLELHCINDLFCTCPAAAAPPHPARPLLRHHRVPADRPHNPPAEPASRQSTQHQRRGSTGSRRPWILLLPWILFLLQTPLTMLHTRSRVH